MNGDENKTSSPSGVVQPAPSIKREAEVSGGIVRDQEVRDRGITEVESPATELAPQIEISKTPVESSIETQPSAPPVPPIGSGQATEPVKLENDKLLSFPNAVEAIKGEGLLTEPTGIIGIGTITVHQDERTKTIKAKEQVNALPKAA